MQNQKNKVYLSFGGNIGDVKTTIEKAILKLLENKDIKLCAKSSYWLTEPQGDKEQDWFVNCVASFFVTNLTPHLLLEKTKEIEYTFGRKRIEGKQNAARTLDIDILDFASIKLDTKELTLPHSRMFERAFVLVPLCEISPQYSYNSKEIQVYLESIEYKVEENKIYQS